MKFVRIISGLLAGLFIISGCTPRQAPDPALTAVGAGYGSSGNRSADWISPEDVARNRELGLDVRSGMSGLAGADGRIENMFAPVYFDFDQSFVRPSDRPTLQSAADYLNANPNARLLIEGNCDWRGTTEYNMSLGDRRAAAAKAYLVQLGIADNRIETLSKGDLNAVTEGDESQMQLDRRADLIVFP